MAWREVKELVRGWVVHHPRLAEFARAQALRARALRHEAARHVPSLIAPRTRNLTVAVTARCNLRCAGCRYGRSFMNGAELPLPLVHDLLADAAALGIRDVRLYGGEPLLHRDLPAMVERATRLGLRPYVTTNAVLLRDRMLELFAAGLRFVTIGYYGSGPEHASYTGDRRAAARIEASLASLRERFGDAVRIRLNWLLMRPTCSVQALREVVAFAQRYRTRIQVDLVHYSLPYFTEGPDRCLQFRDGDRPQIEAVVAELLALKREHPDLLQQSELALRSIPDWLLLRERMRVPCDKYEMVWVGADGTVQLCYVTFRLGNLHERRLRDLLYTQAHACAARDAFALRCPNCHCGYDTRVARHLPSRRRFAAGR
jgi:cyclic pyranopterin phosphate synthase